MANRWISALTFFGLMTAAVACAEVVAPPAPPAHVEALCHSWTESPCLLRVGGTLRGAETGQPLAGKRLRFVAEGNLICSSTTDSTGRASCLGIVASGRAVTESGYRIMFDGEGRLLPSSAAGTAIVRIGGPSGQ